MSPEPDLRPAEPTSWKVRSPEPVVSPDVAEQTRRRDVAGAGLGVDRARRGQLDLDVDGALGAEGEEAVAQLRAR